MEPITASIALALILGFSKETGKALLTDLFKDPLKDTILGKLMPEKEVSNFRERFLEAFFKAFEEYKNQPDNTAEERAITDEIVATIKKKGKGNYQVALLNIFRYFTDRDFTIFISKMAFDSEERTKMTAQIITTFSLQKLIVYNLPLDKQRVSKVLKTVLDIYYKTFLAKMTTKEGVQITLDVALNNQQLLLKIISHLEKQPSQKFPHYLTNLPDINPDNVIGREKDLKDLIAKLKESNKVAVVKGIGKTTLAKLKAGTMN